MGRRRVALGLCSLLLALPAVAADHWFRADAFAPPRADRAAAGAEDVARAEAIGAPAGARLDPATGRFTLLLPSEALLDAAVRRTAIDEGGRAKLAERAAATLRGWISARAEALRIDPAELGEPRVTVHGADLVQLSVPRVVAGIPVRDAVFVATISHGRLSLAGTDDWADTPTPDAALPRVDVEVARDALAAREPASRGGREWKAPELAWAVARESGNASLRLAWVLRSDLGEPGMRYEALVDAADGTLLAVSDIAAYAATPRTVSGGVFPLSNDGADAQGTEQAAWPMPFATVTTPTGTVTTDASGRLPTCVDGSITASLSGSLVAVSDSCGATTTSSAGSIDYGVSGGTNCTVPVGQPAGDTHAARSAYFELSRLQAIARSRLPTTTFFQQPFQVQTNLNTSTCNAFWNGANLQLFRNGSGCANTGEIASIFDHEWGHALDNHNANPAISSPGEAIADAVGNWRHSDSCIGRGFLLGVLCNGDGTGDACLTCTGVRESDFAKNASGTPFGLTAVTAACPATGTRGPCNRETHCEGQVVSQAVWDLWNRDLRASPFNLDSNTASEIAARMIFLASGPVTNWYQCTTGTAGCAATSGYLNFLATDDDNGNLLDGTPHMTAIASAFNRHGIGCNTLAAANSGCAAGPTAAPTVTTTALDGAARLQWTAVANAATYQVLRTDGLVGCNQGKELVATVTGTQFVDTGLRNGRPYSYVVLPVGSNASCAARASTCATVTPVAGGAPELDAASAQVATTGGDGDLFVDNCETSTVTLPFSNVGTGAAANVRITAVSSPTHPSTQVLSALPLTVATGLASCAAASVPLQVKPQGLAPGDTLRLAITWTSDALGGVSRTTFVDVPGTEQDLQSFASRTFDFETNAEGWVTTSGTFGRSTASPGGAGGAGTAYLRTSQALPDACDAVVSPVLTLSPTSTMSMQTFFTIEPASGGEFFDRANVGIRPLGGTRTLVTPSGGRLYTASGPNSACGTTGQGGWAGTSATWGASTWSTANLQSATFAGQPVQIDIRYSTDSSLSPDGFRFDQLTVTNAAIAVPDAQSDTCGQPVAIFSNGFE